MQGAHTSQVEEQEDFDEGAKRLAGFLGGCRALTHLDLSCNQICDQGAKSLAGGAGGLEGADALRFALEYDQWRGRGEAGGGAASMPSAVGPSLNGSAIDPVYIQLEKYMTVSRLELNHRNRG